MSLKPLYLDGAASASATVRLDGPALKVLSRGRCAGRYPLRRLSRVIVSGAVNWSTPALIACLRNGIVVTFLDSNGEFVGMRVGATVGRMKLSDRLKEFALRPDWPDHYANWYAAMEHSRILDLTRTVVLDAKDLRPATVRRSCLGHLGRLAPVRTVTHTVGYLESALAACAARTALECGIPGTLLIDEGAGHQLSRDLGRLLAWEAPIIATRLLAKKWPL